MVEWVHDLEHKRIRGIMIIDQLLIVKILLTLVTLGYALVTLIADFNKTHATNPLWTGHARFHVVWQTLSYLGFAILALGLIWFPGPYVLERLFLVIGFASVIIGSFFISLLAIPIYGGDTCDKNGYSPIFIAGKKFDLNFLTFTSITLLLVFTFWLLLKL